MNDLKKVLFLPGWYPNKSDRAVGSFIRNHAEAVNNRLKVDVLHICGDEILKKLYSFEKSEISGVDTYILYYRKSKSKKLIAQLFKAFLYVFGQFYGYYKYRRLNPKPTFFHVHVLTRAAILPFVLSFFKKSDYFITEHWTRYLPQDGAYDGEIRKFFTNWVVKRSKGITAVSGDLRFHMQRHGIVHDHFKLISNVVKPVFFDNNAGIKSIGNHFCHVSNFAKGHKNVLGLLEVFKTLQNQGYSFSLTMVGDGDDFELANEKAVEYGLAKVNFTGFLYGSDVVREIKKASALVLFSNYENQPVVITESLSLGVPVIATTVGGIPEMINESNGTLVEPKDVDALANAIKQVITGEINFDGDIIKEEAAQKFKSDVVAQKFIEFYREGGIDL
ncbi:Glycogen synthase [compost metagenome]